MESSLQAKAEWAAVQSRGRRTKAAEVSAGRRKRDRVLDGRKDAKTLGSEEVWEPEGRQRRRGTLTSNCLNFMMGFVPMPGFVRSR